MHEIKECKCCDKPYLAKPKHKKFCTRLCKELYSKDRQYRLYKQSVCAFCGFVPIDPCQLDVDHIDGNHNNNSIDNLQTLCANCHRLKTKMDSLKP